MMLNVICEISDVDTVFKKLISAMSKVTEQERNPYLIQIEAVYNVINFYTVLKI